MKFKTTHRSSIHKFLAISGLSGIVAMFLPFTSDVSPLGGFVETFDDLLYGGRTAPFCKLTIPFFLAVLVSVASLRWIISGTLLKVERLVAFILSFSIAGITLSLFFDGGDNRGMIVLGIVMLIFAMGTFLVVRTSRDKMHKPFSPIMAMQTVYFGNCFFCLIAFWGDWQIGAYISLITVASYIAQIIIISVRTNKVKKLE